ncbi:sensor histidine kinase [Flammeovirga pectinis]|uniref:Sensor histidine kinase n=1 Tax=Flammeovirga pectinis TaxID=2494373 RepID=A0A3Q9FS65_9BACT|nr:histidine kinase [Flammeovirga pectinis]AZQ64700.1 sensor histidine kinase [Flammeovirga pectinis]
MNELNKRNSLLYWQCQFLGWGTVSLYWAYRLVAFSEYSMGIIVLNYILDVGISIGLTHMYKHFAIHQKWTMLDLSSLFIRLVPSIIVLAAIFTLLNNLKWYYCIIFGTEEQVVMSVILMTWDPIFITGLRMMSIWVLAYHLYHFYQREIQTAKENTALAQIVQQAQLDNLQTQLNPHFLFNSLNSIKALVIERPEIARRAIDLLSDILRTSLYEKDTSLIGIQQELSLVNDYIELEKLRFEERLTTSFSIDETLMQHKIPTLSIQLLIENAIKHGIDKKINGGTIELLITEKESSLFIIVKNPGTFIENNPSKGLGLKNLLDRLEMQYKGKAHFSIQNDAENTVTATLEIPMQ